MQYTVGINIESYFNLWYAARCWWDPIQVETANSTVCRSNRAFTL